MSDRAADDLSLIEDFVNTLDLEEGVECLGSPPALAGWLADHGLAAPDETFDDGDLARTRTVREALRALLLTNNGGEPDPGAAGVLTAAGDAARLTVAVDDRGRAALEPRAAGIDRVFGRLLAVVTRAQADGTWERMKACPWQTCHFAFYDHSRNRSRTWCSMAVCGNRSKARAYRHRGA
jgi:predicted RNA-binding Zn ribbon-like protein